MTLKFFDYDRHPNKVLKILAFVSYFFLPAIYVGISIGNVYPPTTISQTFVPSDYR